MASSGFSISMQLILNGPSAAQIQSVASSIQKGLGNVQANVKVTAPGNAASTINKINQSIASVTKNASAAKTATYEFGEAVGIASRKFTSFAIASGTIIGFIAALRNGVGAAVAFQNELVRFKQVGGDSASTIQSVAKTISELSTQLGTSSGELSKVAVTLRQAGISAGDTAIALQALAKASVAPTFTDLENTVEGSIAAMQQFGIQAKDLEGVLGTINKVSADFAVESDDLVHAIQRSGGAFKSAGGNLNELLSLFTSVRQTTRESAETIASGFNTIFARVQRPQTIEQLKLMGINLRFTRQEAENFGKTEGDFVGPYEAIGRLNAALKNVPTASAEYASIVEAIGGFRQVSKVIPLIQKFDVAQRAMGSALAGTTSLEQSQVIAQQSFALQISKVNESFLDLFRTLTGNKVLQGYAKFFLSMADHALKLTKSLEPLIPLVTTLATLKIGSLIGRAFSPDFAKGLGRGLSTNKPFAAGGVVPGTGNSDSVFSLLTPGEFVVRKSAAKSIGYSNLHNMNKYAAGGRVDEQGIYHFATAGSVPKPKKDKQSFFPTPKAPSISKKSGVVGNTAFIYPPGQKVAMLVSDTKVTSQDKSPSLPVASLTGNSKKRFMQDIGSLIDFGALTQGEADNIKAVTVPIRIRGLNEQSGTKAKKVIEDGVLNSLNQFANIFDEPSAHIDLTKTDSKAVLDLALGNSGIGRIFEGFLQVVGRKLKSRGLAKTPSDVFDFNPVDVQGYSRLFGNDVLGLYGDAKYTDSSLNRASVVSKALRAFGVSHMAALQKRALDEPATATGGKGPLLDQKGNVVLDKKTGQPLTRLQFIQRRQLESRKFAVGGKVYAEADASFFAEGGAAAGTDTVPALLTPGEFVINRRSAQQIGYNKLHSLNKLATGGPVSSPSSGDKFPAYGPSGDSEESWDWLTKDEKEKLRKQLELVGKMKKLGGMRGIAQLPRYAEGGEAAFAERRRQLFQFAQTNKKTGVTTRTDIAADNAEKFLAGTLDKYPTSQTKSAITQRLQRVSNFRPGVNATGGEIKIPFPGDSLALIGLGNVGDAGPNVLSRSVGQVSEKLSESAKSALKKLNIKNVTTLFTRHIISKQATKDFTSSLRDPVARSIEQVFQQRFTDSPDFKLTASEVASVEGVLFEKYIRGISKTRLTGGGNDQLFDYPKGINPNDNFNKIVLPSPIKRGALTDAKRTVAHASTTASIASKYLNYKVNDLLKLAGLQTKEVKGPPAKSLPPIADVVRVYKELSKAHDKAIGDWVKLRKNPENKEAASAAITEASRLSKLQERLQGKYEKFYPNAKPLSTKPGYYSGADAASKLKPFAKGGAVGTDSVPALLTPGEFVINRAAAQRIGYNNLSGLNRYVTGGEVKKKYRVRGTKSGQAWYEDYSVDTPEKAAERAVAQGIYIEKIEDISAKQGILGRIFGKAQPVRATGGPPQPAPAPPQPRPARTYNFPAELGFDPSRNFLGYEIVGQKDGRDLTAREFHQTLQKQSSTPTFAGFDSSKDAAGVAARGTGNYRSSSQNRPDLDRPKNGGRIPPYSTPISAADLINQAKMGAGINVDQPGKDKSDIADPIVKALHDILGELKKPAVSRGGGVGQGPRRQRISSPAKGADATQKEEEKAQPGFFKKLFSKGDEATQLRRTVAIQAVSVAAQYAPSLLEKQFGTVEKPGSAGVGGARFTAGVGGLISEAGIGASVGGSLFGPIGATVGGVVGALHGFMSATQEADRQIRQISFAKSMKDFSFALEQAASTTGKLRTTNIEDIRGGLGKISEEANFAPDRKTFFAEQVNTGELQQLQQRLVENLDFTKGFDPKKSFQEFLESSGGLGRQLSRLQTEAEGLSFADFEKRTEEAITRIGASKVREAAELKLAAVVDLQSRNFTALGKAIEEARTKAADMADVLDLVSASAEGKTFTPTANIDRPKFGTTDSAEFARSIDPIINSFGAAGGDMVKELRRIAIGINEAAVALPGALKELAAKDLGGENLGAGLLEILDRSTRDIPKDIKENLDSALTSIDPTEALKNIKANPQAFTDRLLDLLNSNVKPALESAAQNLDDQFNLINKSITAYGDLVNKVAQAQGRVFDAQVDLAQHQTGVSARRLGAPSLAEGAGFQATALKFNVGQIRTAARGGVGADRAFNPAALGGALSVLTDKIKEQQERVTDLDRSGPRDQALAAHTEFDRLQRSAGDLRGALENLADASGRVAAIQDRINQLDQENVNRRSFSEKFLTAGFQERAQMLQTVRGTNVAVQQGNLQGFNTQQAKAILDFLHETGDIRQFGPVKNKDIADQLVDRTPENQFLRLLGLGSGTPEIEGERQGLENEQTRQLAVAAQAQKELAGSLKTTQNNFFTTLEDIQRNFFSDLQHNLTTQQRDEAQGKVEDARAAVEVAKKRKEAGETLTGLGIRPEELTKTPDILAKLQPVIEATNRVSALSEGIKSKDVIRSEDRLGVEESSRRFRESSSKVDPLLATLGIGSAHEKATADLRDLQGKISGSIDQRKILPAGFDVGKISEQIVGPAIQASLSRGEGDVDDILKEVRGRIDSILKDELSQATQTKNEAVDQVEKTTGFKADVILNLANNSDKASKALADLGNPENMGALIDAFTKATGKVNETTAALQSLKDILAGKSTPEPAPAPGVVERAKGGPIFRARGTDTVPAMLSPGEFVVNANAARSNRGLLERMNSGKGTVYAAFGGSVEDLDKVDVLINQGDQNRVGDIIPRLKQAREILDSIQPAPEYVQRIRRRRFALDRLEKELGQHKTDKGLIDPESRTIEGIGGAYGALIAADRRAGRDTKLETHKTLAERLTGQFSKFSDQLGTTGAFHTLETIVPSAISSRSGIDIPSLRERVDLEQEGRRRRGLSQREKQRFNVKNTPLALGPSLAFQTQRQGKETAAENARIGEGIYQGGLETQEQLRQGQQAIAQGHSANIAARKTLGEFNSRVSQQRRSSIESRLGIKIGENEKASDAVARARAEFQKRKDDFEASRFNTNTVDQITRSMMSGATDFVPPSVKPTVPPEVIQRARAQRAKLIDRKKRRQGDTLFSAQNNEPTPTPLVENPDAAYIQRSKLINRRRLRAGQGVRDFGLNARQALYKGDYNRYIGRGPYFAEGGAVGTDTVPAMLSPGEFIINSRSAGSNLSLLRNINNSKGPIYRQAGGQVSRENIAGGGPGAWNLSQESMGALNGFSAAATALAGTLGNITAPLNLFGESIQLLRGIFDPFNVSATNLGAGMALFNRSADGLTAALGNLANIPRTISVNGRTQIDLNIVGTEALRALSEQIKNDVLVAAADQIRNMVISDIKNGNIVV